LHNSTTWNTAREVEPAPISLSGFCKIWRRTARQTEVDRNRPVYDPGSCILVESIPHVHIATSCPCVTERLAEQCVMMRLWQCSESVVCSLVWCSCSPGVLYGFCTINPVRSAYRRLSPWTPRSIMLPLRVVGPQRRQALWRKDDAHRCTVEGCNAHAFT
jgi:hypothetical protein